MTGKIRVLHVDDEPDFAEMSAQFLRRQSDRITVETAQDVDEARTHLERESFDCVVSDYDMPGQTGIDLLQAIREESPELPFILFTGKGSEEIASKAVSAGVTDYLQKETGADQYVILANRIENVVDRVRAEDRAQEALSLHRSLTEDALDTSEVGTFILDAKFEIVWINSIIETYFDIDRNDVIGEDKRELINSHIASIFEHPEEFAETVTATYDDNSYVEQFECHILEGPDREERWLRHWSQPIETGRFAGGRIEHYTDISEYKKREQEITRLNELHETVLSNIRDTVLVTDDAGRFTYVCPNVQFIFGYDREEVVELGTIERLLGEQLVDAEELQERGEIHNLETSVKNKAGQLRHLLVTISSVDIEDGSQLYSIRDITDRTDREAQLRELNETTHRLMTAESREQISEIGVEAARDVLGLAVNAIHLYDDEQAALVPVAGTEAVAALVGDPPTFFEGDSIAWRAYDQGEALALDDVHDDPDIYNPETPIRSELHLPLGDHGILIAGSETPNAFDQRDVVFGEILAGAIAAALEQIKQTTQLRAREQELEQTNALLSTLFETLPAGVTVLDTGGRITRANQRAEDVLGLTESEITERAYDDPNWQHYDQDGNSIPEEDLPYAQVMATGEPVIDYEHGIRWPDGRERWLTMSVTPITSETGDIERVVAVISDITEQHEYEQKIQQQNERLEQFASVVSHDLRNPLNVVEGRVELAREDCDSEHLDDIGRAVERMNVLIEDLLTLAREGDTVGDTESIDLSSLVENCWDNVATTEATFAIDIDRQIQADKSRLQQLLENLMRNAVEHGGEDVMVTIGELDGGFYVEDDGPGIPEHERDDVFEAGYSTGEDGTGFGLSIVKEVAQAHGWDIRVTGGSEGGARFEITGVEFAAE